MGYTKKLARFGGRSYGIVLNQGILEMLGTSIEEAESEGGVEITMKFYGDTLIVRRAGRPPLTPSEAVYFVTEDLEFAKYFPSSPISLKDGEADFEPGRPDNLFREGKEVRVTKLMRRALHAFKAFGPLSRKELAEHLGAAPAQATSILSRGFEDDLLVKQGQQYALNPEVFNV